MKKLIILFLLSLTTHSSLKAQTTQDYCLAIRGNGEVMPAHWGAMSRVVEHKGLPRAMSGGSSGSITMFLLESLALNHSSLSFSDQAFLIKTFQGYFEALTQTSEGKAIGALVQDKKAFGILVQKIRQLGEITLEEQLLLKKHLKSIEVLLKSEELKSLINPEFLKYVSDSASSNLTPEQVQYRKGQIRFAVENFGKFSAQTDETILFRPGLASFKSVALVLGKMGDFYSQSDFSELLGKCAKGTNELTWMQITEKNPLCRGILFKSVLGFKSHGIRINESVGEHLDVFPTTSLIMGNSVNKFRLEKFRYLQNSASTFKSDFSAPQKDLKFAYWGKSANLDYIAGNLPQDDEKSSKFYPLGNARWLDILSASPAEPGLSNLVDLNEKMISAGGWSDLHPTMLLKAFGCNDIVYLTRKGGESLFAQGMMKRLTSYDGFDFSNWTGLSKEEKKERNLTGDFDDVGPFASTWSRLYNMANPESSLRKSMALASTVVCTDWDGFDVFKQMNDLINEAFRSEWITDKNKLCR